MEELGGGIQAGEGFAGLGFRAGEGFAGLGMRASGNGGSEEPHEGNDEAAPLARDY